jgi:hypothetical protein
VTEIEPQLPQFLQNAAKICGHHGGTEQGESPSQPVVANSALPGQLNKDKHIKATLVERLRISNFVP